MRAPDLAVYLLTPGFGTAYHQQVLGVSNATLWKYTQWARELARQDPALSEGVADNVASITCDDGLLMAQRRGTAHLPFWSRLAICEYLQVLDDAAKIARMFRCSKRTLYNVRTGQSLNYDLLTGVRRPNSTQLRPPAVTRPTTKTDRASATSFERRRP
jgi:hypothetical protein